MCLVCQASEEADKSYESTDTLKKMVVCQKNGQSLGEADECGKSLTHFEVCQSVSELPSPAVYGEDGNPFVKGEAVKFDCFPFGSTKLHLNAFAFGCFLFAFIHTQGDPKFPKPQFRNKTTKKEGTHNL